MKGAHGRSEIERRTAERRIAEVEAADSASHPSAGGHASTKPRRVALRGLRRTVDLLVGRIEDERRGRGPGFGSLHRSFVVEHRALERELAQRGVDGAELAAESRSVRGWLAWMARETVLARTVDASRIVADAVNRRLSDSDDFLRALLGRRRIARGTLVSDPLERVAVAFRPMRAITRVEVSRGAVRLSLAAGLVAVEGEDLDRLIDMVVGDREARRRIHEAMLEPAFQAAYRELVSAGGVPDVDAARVHDLAASFDRIDARYFDGAMSRPRLAWSARSTRRTFGHYEFVSDTVTLSRRLDREDVPEFVVDFIMYHELLHKKHGLDWSGSCARAHTAAFRADERRFERFTEAEAELRRIARRS